MKRYILALLVAILALLSFTSCFNTGGEEANDTNAIYGNGIITQIISTDSEIDLTALAQKIGELCGTRPALTDDASAAKDHEIVFGDSKRDISVKAREALNQEIEAQKQNEDAKWYNYYIIYSDGSSVAIVWSDESVKTNAAEYFIANYVKESTLKINDGHKYVGSVNWLDAMRAEEDVEREAAYAKIEKLIGAEAVTALRAHFAIYDERFYLWLANLYDPGEYDDEGNPLGGGFYYTPSARDTYGYGIDIESTQQALSFLTDSGMIRGKIREALPEKMIKEMVAFALSLQSSVDGYFYHPQWGTSIGSSRQSRDLGWATTLLSSFGYQPYWNAPNGVKGIYGEPGMNNATSSLTESHTVAVSSVVATASNVNKWPERLRSIENWEAYLKSFESTISTNSYSIGHTVAEQTSQIKTRDEEAKANGEPTGYVALTEYYFNLWQNPENGLWEENATYASINGLMKIMAIYTNLKLKFSYGEEAFASALEIIALRGPDADGVEAKSSTYVYNPWCAVSRIFSCLNNQGDNSITNSLREVLYSRAEELIRATTAKTIPFKKSDGSFGFNYEYSNSSQQGVPSAVPYTVEGDIDGGCIAVTAVTVNMMAAFGMSKMVTVYSPSDLYLFLDEIATLEHIAKEPTNVENEVIDFEDLNGKLPFRIDRELTGGTVEIADEGYESDGALRLITVSDNGDAVIAKPFDTSSGNCYVVEFDMLFEEVKVNSAIQFSIGSMYTLTMTVRTNGNLVFGDESNYSNADFVNTFSGTYNAFEWHRIRLEHYRTPGETVMTVFYLDGEKLAVSDNYFGKIAASSTVPVSRFDYVKFYAKFAADFTVLLDNIYIETNLDKYSENYPD